MVPSSAITVSVIEFNNLFPFKTDSSLQTYQAIEGVRNKKYLFLRSMNFYTKTKKRPQYDFTVEQLYYVWENLIDEYY